MLIALAKKKVIRGKGEKGITLLELLIGVTVSGIVIGAATLAFQQLQEGQKQLSEDLSAIGLEAIGNRQLWADARRAGVSFNLMNLTADDESALGKDGDPTARGGNFFAFLPDYNCTAEPCARKFSLKTEAQSFVMAVTRGGLSAPASVTAGLAYDVAKAASPICVGGKGINCVGGWNIPDVALNWNKLMDQLAAKDDPAAGPADSLVRKHQVLWFYSPVTARTTTGSSPPNMNEPPKRMSFVGKVAADGLSIEQVTIPGFLETLKRPGTNQDIDTIDKFFRWLPPVGGAQAFALVVPVTFLRYRLREGETIRRKNDDGVIESHKVMALVREVYNPESKAADKFEGARPIVAPVASVDFFRPSISSASIKARINLDRQRHIGGQ